LVKTLLNRVQKHKGFVYERVEYLDDETGRVFALRAWLRERRGSRPVCGGCGRPGPGYDRLAARTFDFVPIWGIAVVLVYALRRVACPTCGVKVEAVPWAAGKSRLTTAMACWLAEWARDLSWSRVAERFGTTWHAVSQAVRWVVDYGLAHRDLSGVRAIGVDEIASGKGHQYLTLVYQIDAGCRRLLWVGAERTEATLRRFFAWFGPARSAALGFVASDMWQPYLKVIRACAGGALHILDRFHLVANLNKALDQVRRQEARRLREAGAEPVLKHSRWCLLKRVSNLTRRQGTKLRELLRMNLTTVRAYLLKEEFQQLWEYVSPGWAGRFLDAWCTRVMRSRIEPLKKVARSLRQHRQLILNWFAAQGEYSTGIVEGLNHKIKTRVRISCGYRTSDGLQTALYHTLGRLPVPELTHRFF
jgi:transposase